MIGDSVPGITSRLHASDGVEEADVRAGTDEATAKELDDVEGQGGGSPLGGWGRARENQYMSPYYI